MLTDFVVFLD